MAGNPTVYTASRPTASTITRVTANGGHTACHSSVRDTRRAAALTRDSRVGSTHHRVADEPDGDGAGQQPGGRGHRDAKVAEPEPESAADGDDEGEQGADDGHAIDNRHPARNSIRVGRRRLNRSDHLRVCRSTQAAFVGRDASDAWRRNGNRLARPERPSRRVEPIPPQNTHQVSMRPAELLALVYFVSFGAAALALRRRRARWPVTLGWAAGGLASRRRRRWRRTMVRDWWLLAALPLAYWAPAPLTVTPTRDWRDGCSPWTDRLGLTRGGPTAAVCSSWRICWSIRLCRRGCWQSSPVGPELSADYCLALLLAVLPCYGLLPLLPTRPPRVLVPSEMPAAPSRRRDREAGERPSAWRVQQCLEHPAQRPRRRRRGRRRDGRPERLTVGAGVSPAGRGHRARNRARPVPLRRGHNPGRCAWVLAGIGV